MDRKSLSAQKNKIKIRITFIYKYDLSLISWMGRIFRSTQNNENKNNLYPII